MPSLRFTTQTVATPTVELSPGDWTFAILNVPYSTDGLLKLVMAKASEKPISLSRARLVGDVFWLNAEFGIELWVEVLNPSGAWVRVDSFEMNCVGISCDLLKHHVDVDITDIIAATPWGVQLVRIRRDPNEWPVPMTAKVYGSFRMEGVLVW